MASKGTVRGHGALQDSAWDATAISASADPLADGPARAVWVGTGGSITVTMCGGASVTFAGIANGTLLPIQITHMTAVSGASGVLALY